MTKYRWHNAEITVHKSKTSDPFDDLPDTEGVRALRRLVEDGLVADSGRKRWCKETGRYEIVWVATELGVQTAIEAPLTLKQRSRPRRLN
jgi:hypothetical protein